MFAQCDWSIELIFETKRGGERKREERRGSEREEERRTKSIRVQDSNE